MAFLTFFGLISAGFVLGYFLAFPALIGVSCICLIVCVVWLMRSEGLGTFLAIMVFLYALIGNLVMWGTYYVSTGQTWLGEMFRDYILR